MVKALDALKSVLAERKAKAQKLTAESGQKWVRRSDLEQKRVEEYLENQRQEEEKAKADEEERFRKFNEHLAKSEAMNKQASKDIPGHLYDEALLGDDDAEPPLSIGEVIERLREMALPITLFGETDMQRYRRLRNEEKEAHEGKKNPDVVMLESLHHNTQMMLNDQAEKEGDDDDDDEENAAEGGTGGNNEEDDEDKEDSDAEDPADADELLNGGGRRAAQPEANSDKSDSDCEDAGMQAVAAADTGDKSDSDAEDPTAAPAAKQPEFAMQDNIPKPGEDLPQVEVSSELMDRCDFIRTWARKALKAWEKELADKPEEDKKKALVKQEMAQHRQVRRDVRPLQKRLRMYVLDEFLLGKIHNIVSKAAEREYRDANEAYLDLSIGKAAWPVGIGCGGSMLMEDAIGLHDRFNRMSNVKDIAFALNDDVTRKYVQALKRLMNVAARYWPPDDPSKL